MATEILKGARILPLQHWTYKGADGNVVEEDTPGPLTKFLRLWQKNSEGVVPPVLVFDPDTEYVVERMVPVTITQTVRVEILPGVFVDHVATGVVQQLVTAVVRGSKIITPPAEWQCVMAYANLATELPLTPAFYQVG